MLYERPDLLDPFISGRDLRSEIAEGDELVRDDATRCVAASLWVRESYSDDLAHLVPDGRVVDDPGEGSLVVRQGVFPAGVE